MMIRRKGREGADDRRETLRRDEDVETRTIVEHAVHDAPLVRQLLKSGKLAGACLALGAFLGGTGGAIGFQLSGPRDAARALGVRVDTNAATIRHQAQRFDSLIVVMSEMKRDIETLTLLQCIQARRRDPDLRPHGCDEAEGRGARAR